MEPSKEDIKTWLKRHRHTREWLGDQCGKISKRTVDNWLSSPAEIPPGALTIIGRLMQDDAIREAERTMEPKLQNLVLEVDVPTFERWSRAALSHDEIVTEYAIRVIEEAAKADMDSSKITRYPEPQEEIGTDMKKAAEQSPEGI